MRVKIDIDTRTFIRFGLVAIGFVVALMSIYRVRSALVVLGLSLFLSLALNPPVTRIARRLPGRSRVGATALAYLIVVSLLGGLVFTVVPPIVEQTSKFAATIPGLIDQANSQRGVIKNFVERYGLEEQLDRSVENAKQQASKFAANLGNVVVGSVASFFSGAVTLLVVLVLGFLMLIEGPGWLAKIWGLYHDQSLLERHRSVVQRMYRVVTGYVNGQILVAFIASLCTLATVLILSLLFPLPTNLAFASAAAIFLTGLIPMFGATLGAILVGLMLLLNDAGAALVFVIYFIVYQQIENNFISPTIQSRAVELSALAVLSAILIGTSLFGLIGGLISIPIAGCIRVLVLDHIAHHSRSTGERRIKLAVKTDSHPKTK